MPYIFNLKNLNEFAAEFWNKMLLLSLMLGLWPNSQYYCWRPQLLKRDIMCFLALGIFQSNSHIYYNLYFWAGFVDLENEITPEELKAAISRNTDFIEIICGEKIFVLDWILREISPNPNQSRENFPSLVINQLRVSNDQIIIFFSTIK